MNKLHLNLGENSYTITIGSDILKKADKYFNLNRKVLIVTDDGVPSNYAKEVASCAKEAKIVTLPMGEGTKSLEGFSRLLNEMCLFDMGRKDCAVAVGGGVIGDLVGFACASYMRGIDFYNVPTTLLSQVDSSIGGKTAINFEGIKNIVGAFHQPKGVLIDTDTLKTLPSRHISAGLAESIKMSLTSDEELFMQFERLSKEEILENIEHIITRSLMIKKSVVEKDEKEAGLRKILNFGHTFGHGVEAEFEMKGLYHGECVAIGMIPMCPHHIRIRLIKVLDKLSLPTEYNGDIDYALSFVTHDKKCLSGVLDVITLSSIGNAEIVKMSTSDFGKYIKDNI